MLFLWPCSQLGVWCSVIVVCSCGSLLLVTCFLYRLDRWFPELIVLHKSMCGPIFLAVQWWKGSELIAVLSSIIIQFLERTIFQVPNGIILKNKRKSGYCGRNTTKWIKNPEINIHLHYTMIAYYTEAHIYDYIKLQIHRKQRTW